MIIGGNMKIGIDLGGSHIATGLVYEGKIIKKIEYDFSEEEKGNLEQTLRKVICKHIECILKNSSIDEIEYVGVCVPRKT